jgi:hypothetical protein
VENRKEVLEGILPYLGRRRGDVKSSTVEEEEYLPNREGAKTLVRDLRTTPATPNILDP